MRESEKGPRRPDEDTPPDDAEVMEVLGSSHSSVTDFDELLDTVGAGEEEEGSPDRGAGEEGSSER